MLARSSEKIPSELRPYADVVEADSFDPEQVAAATKGVDAVYWVDPKVFSAAPLADYARATHAIVTAAESNGIGRIVLQSSIGAELRHGVGEIDGLAQTEMALDALDADVTHPRCGYFYTNLLLDIDAVRRGRLQTVQDPDRP